MVLLFCVKLLLLISFFTLSRTGLHSSTYRSSRAPEQRFCIPEAKNIITEILCIKPCTKKCKRTGLTQGVFWGLFLLCMGLEGFFQWGLIFKEGGWTQGEDAASYQPRMKVTPSNSCFLSQTVLVIMYTNILQISRMHVTRMTLLLTLKILIL